MFDNLIKIGKIVSTHAIRGEVKFLLDNKYLLLKEIKNIKIFLEDKQGKIDVYEIEKSYFINKKQILKLKNINNINEAKPLINNIVYIIKNDELIEIKETFIEFEAFYKESKYGIIIDEMYNGAQDLVKVKNQKNEFWIPCVEVYIESIDYGRKIIFFKNIEGLF
ncbi:ribosome maturation factor RimM [Spiroplasma taiwanense]|uniref:Ribosome maturation factor RimM n=1 Tax=Spiroplasma taiwanense CT-1 TaxID=1276220 RepID=S5LWH4_9MOLU|nr:16S rRNA processing protein rimM [Spiroplasma taiwanense]AGR40981.1 16S rRNA processing protein rimM [Spiroplasma taiwanense CT-1]